MSASWDSDLSSIIEKTNNNLKLLRKIGDKPQVRAPDVSATAGGPPSLARSGSVSSHGSSARPRAYVGAQDDAGSVGSRGSARPRAFVRGDDDNSSMGSHGSARPKAYVRGDDDTGSMGSRGSARPKAFIRGDDDTGSMSSRSSARPTAFIRGDDDSGSISSRSSARPKAFIRADDDSGSISSRSSARPKAFIRPDDDAGSMSSRSSARPKAFIRGDDDTGSMSSRSSARPKAFIRGDDDSGSMSSNQGLGRSRLDSGHGSVASASSRPHVGIAGGGGLTAAMLQQHRATAGTGGVGALAMADLSAPRPRYDLDETRSMSGVSISSRLNRRVGADGRVPHARPLGSSLGPRIRVPDSDIPSDVPKHVIEEVKKSLETHFASRNGAVDKKVADLRTDVAGLTTQTSALGSQISELRDAVLVSANSKPSSSAPAVSDPKLIASVQANAAAIARLEEHSADLLGRKVSVDRELTELGSRVKSLSSATMKISTLEDNIEALVANRQKQEQGLFKLADRVQLMHRQMGGFVDMKAVENLLNIRLTREFRVMEDRLAQNVVRMAEKMEQKVQSMEKQSSSQRQESLAALKNDLSDDIQRLQSSALRKSDLLPIQNAQTQSKEDLAQLSSALVRQEKKLQDAKLASSTLRDELADARSELNKTLQTHQRSAAAMLEERLEQIASGNKDKSNKFDDQLAELAKKQKKLEEATETLKETMAQVKAEAGQRFSRSSADREEENDKLRQRLARSVAELEALASTKAEVERRFAGEEQQYQSRLKELRTTLTETEKQKEAQRLELMQKLQEESKLMGVAQGKNTLLENLLAREKSENEEKNELVRKSKKEVAEVHEQIRTLESEKQKKVRQLTSELQAKQTQVGLLTKTLKRIETASAKMLDLSKREAKTVRRVKATKEHELFIAQLKLKEMERVAQALQNGDEMKKQAALTAASTEERNELEKLLLESQLEKDELKQELEEMTDEFHAAKESQKVIMEDTITKLSSDYDEKISELKQQIADKEQAMRQLRDTLVEKSNLDALEDELAALKDEKNDLLEQIQRAQIEHERVTLKTETNLRLEHATEFAAMKSKFEERIADLDAAKSELEATKAKIADLETELEKQEALHQREVSTLTHDIKEARGKIDECTAQILDLEETKSRLEGEVSQMEANIGGASAEKEEELAAIKSRLHSEVDKLRAELADVSSTLEEKQAMLKEAKQSDEANRQRLVEMAMAQEEMQSRYVHQIDSLTLKLNQERESSRAREQDLEDSITRLNADVKALKAESNKELEAARSELTDQMTELTTTLKASQHREQQLQSRLKRILEELVQAANASSENDVAEETAEMSDDEAITHHLDALYATHRRTAHELERLQAEYELTVKQAAADSATAQELDSQVKEHETQIRELESVVEQLRGELKEQYHKSAIIAKGSDEFSDEMASLREEKRQLERQLQEEEKDRAKREVSYQRRTEMKEREVEDLRSENKALTAAVAAVREKIRAVENVKYHDLGELQSKLKDLEERTAALQPDENSMADMEKDFTATRQEVVTLTAEVQSLYQKLTACCGIMEWSELRASVFDEEEKLTRVRSESARELAKVRSVEQEVLMNAEFLNALLVAHGSGGDGNLLNDFRWMQKYASIAPEIVEKLRKVESRLRDAVLYLHDSSASLFPDGVSKAPLSSSADEVVARPPNSQKAAVDGAAIALALEKAKEDYFSETSEAADGLDEEDVKLEPDVEHEGEQEIPVGHEEEGASADGVAVDGQDSIGGSRACDDVEVAEHVVRAEQERSREEPGTSPPYATSTDFEEDDVAEDRVKQDRSDDDDGLEAKMQTEWSSEEEDMDGVERLALERHSSKQVDPQIDNECDDSEEFATASVHAETEHERPSVVGEDSVDDAKLTEEQHDGEVADDLDPLEESSFDNAMMSALEDKEASVADVPHQPRITRCAVEAELSDSEGFVVQDAIADSSFDDSLLSENDDEVSGREARGVDKRSSSCEVQAPAVQQELSIDGDDLSDSETPADLTRVRCGEGEVRQESPARMVSQELDGDAALNESSSSASGAIAAESEDGNGLETSANSASASDGDQADDGDALETSQTSNASAIQLHEDGALEGSSSRVMSGAIEDADVGGQELGESSSSIDKISDAGQADDGDTLETWQASPESSAVARQRREDSFLEESSSSADHEIETRLGEENSLAESSSRVTSGVRVDPLGGESLLEDSSSSTASGSLAGRADEGDVLDVSASSVASGASSVQAILYKADGLEESQASVENAAPTDQLAEDSALERSTSSIDVATLADRTADRSAFQAPSVDNAELEQYRHDAADRTTSRDAYGASLMLQDDIDDVSDHDEHGGVSISQHDPLGESSSDVDALSEHEEDVSATEFSPLPLKRPEDEDEWSEEQLRAAERSLEGAVAMTDGSEVSGNTEAVPVTAIRMQDSDSSEEEEPMPVQSAPPFSASLSRFGFGSRRVNLEEDDEMDEIERLLVDQSASARSQTRAHPSRFARPSAAADSDDEFGETSLQSREEDSVEFGEASIGSAADGTKAQQATNRPTEPLATSFDDEFGEASLQSREGDDEEIGAGTARPEDLVPTSGRSGAFEGEPHDIGQFGDVLLRSRDEDEFGESSVRSRGEDEFGEASFRSGASDEDEFGEMSIPLHEDADAGTQAHPRTYNSGAAHFTTAATSNSRNAPVRSPPRTTTAAAAHDGSVSDAEQDYLEESFDLEESLEEEDEEKHV
jgi:chromosome segregation ATPase